MLVKYSPWLRYFGEYLCGYLGGKPLMGTPPIPDADRCFMVGCSLYGPAEVAHLEELVSKVPRVGVMFTGGDLLQVAELHPNQRAKAQKAFERCRFCIDGGRDSVAEAEALIQHVVRVVNLPPKHMHALRPLPQGDTFHISFRVSPTYPEDYGYSLVDGAARLLPNTFRFHLHHVAGFDSKHKLPLPLPTNLELHPKGIEDMDAFLSTVSCSLRFPKHDTISMVSIEAMLAGRYVLTNSKQTRHAIVVDENPQAIADAILRARDLCRKRPEGNTYASNYYHSAHSPQQFVDFVDDLLK